MVSIYVGLPEAHITKLITFASPVKERNSIKQGNYEEPQAIAYLYI